ncbi:hypothetical protein GUJ93_ZPchr0007g3755 [Zizania palustris]|uniref:Uncharacterized protein n=1 Tax=Zizania palustris TaxID=103762 RepID=A0A8J5T5L7_ZIZPA|nr:hypothetical protein GUJ93_ZPchr0007g3755 [Zizania palustris]
MELAGARFDFMALSGATADHTGARATGVRSPNASGVPDAFTCDVCPECQRRRVPKLICSCASREHATVAHAS